jgi:secondary thiamine-phosphate synthase enzyme
MIQQYEIHLPAFRKGYHLITHLITEKIGKLPEKGIVHIFIKHTSAAISINENADPSVRYDFESFLNKLIPENDPVYTHTLEGSDDMPAHLKSSLLGQSVTIPIRNGRLDLGTWQGIYLCEFRRQGGSRTVMVTIIGE